METITQTDILTSMLFANMITVMLAYGARRLIRREYDVIGFICTLMPLSVVIVLAWPA